MLLTDVETEAQTGASPGLQTQVCPGFWQVKAMGTDYQPVRSRGGKGGDLSGAVGTGPLGGDPEDAPHLQWDLKPRL